VQSSRYNPDSDKSYDEIDDIEYLRKKQKELMKIKENVDKSLKILMQEQRHIEEKINSSEKDSSINKSLVQRKPGSPLTELMKR
jgi:hypothetical protein